MCIWSLAVSIIGLAIYVMLPSMSLSASAFVWVTGVGVGVSLASLIPPSGFGPGSAFLNQ